MKKQKENKQKQLSLRSEKIKKFLREINDVEFIYIRMNLQMAKDARDLIREFNLTKEVFCELLEIPIEDYEIYLSGGFEYDLVKMALMQTAWYRLQSIKMEEEIGDKYSVKSE